MRFASIAVASLPLFLAESTHAGAFLPGTTAKNDEQEIAFASVHGQLRASKAVRGDEARKIVTRKLEASPTVVIQENPVSIGLNEVLEYSMPKTCCDQTDPSNTVQYKLAKVNGIDLDTAKGGIIQGLIEDNDIGSSFDTSTGTLTLTGNDTMLLGTKKEVVVVFSYAEAGKQCERRLSGLDFERELLMFKRYVADFKKWFENNEFCGTFDVKASVTVSANV